MLSFLLQRFSGRHYKKFLEKALPGRRAHQTSWKNPYQSLTDEQLRAKTAEFRARVAAARTSAELDAILLKPSRS